MHIHGMQNNAAFELSALNAAQRAEARQRAEATRKKLFESASRLAGEAEDCIVTLGEGQEQEGGSRQQQDREQKPDGVPESGLNQEGSGLQASGGFDFLA